MTYEPKAVALCPIDDLCEQGRCPRGKQCGAARIAALEAECAALRKTLESIRDCNQITGIYGTKRLAADALIGIYHAAEEQSHD